VSFVVGLVEWAYWIAREPEVTRFILRYLTLGYSFDISKARERLGYRPLVTVDEGVKRSVKWAMANGWEKK
jgi:sterol-4alpha-carboxylate 3-dehydrogenase (decarboxylating)